MIRKIRQAAVIGSGVMGGGIAALLASAGVKTLLLDIVPFDLKEEEKNDPAARNRIAKTGLDTVIMTQPALLMQPKDVDRIRIGNLEDDFDKLAECDWIVEVVVENLKIKQDLFKRIEPVRKAGAIVSSNTSGIPLKQMSEGRGAAFKQNFLGTHFFNPVRYMKLLEIIPGAETLPEVLAFMADFGERILGKGIVWAKDTPNFVGNRIGVQGMIKAMQLMVEMGVSIPEVDALFGPAMGRPKTAMFKTADLVGLDTMAHVAKNTYDLVTEDESRADFIAPEFIGKMIAAKMLGKKTKVGFYKTDLTPEWKKIRKVIDPATLTHAEYGKPDFACLATAKKAKTLPEKIKAIVYGEDKGAQFAWKALASNLIYAANRIPEIADTIVEIDNAMRWGFNFEMGPFETWDAIGVKTAVAKMEAGGFSVPEKVKAMLAAGNESFYKLENGKPLYYDFTTGAYQPVKVSANIISLAGLKADGKTVKTCPSASLVDLGDDVFCLEFHTKMNAINGEIVDFMAEAMDYVDANGLGMVIGNQAGGMPGAFCAGGDLAYMAGLAKAGQYAEIELSSRKPSWACRKYVMPAFPWWRRLWPDPGGRLRGVHRRGRQNRGSQRTLYGPGGNRCRSVARRRRLPELVEENDRRHSRTGHRRGPGQVLRSHLHGHWHGQDLHVRRRGPRQWFSRPPRPYRFQPRLPDRRGQARSPQDGRRRLRPAGQTTHPGLWRGRPGHDRFRIVQHALGQIRQRIRYLPGPTDRLGDQWR